MVSRVELLEKFAVLMIGIDDKPVPSLAHLEKELFLLTKINPKLDELFFFEKHYFGPYSKDLAEVLDENPQEDDFYYFKDKLICLNEKGKKYFSSIMLDIQQHNKNNLYLIRLMKLLRTIYDKLSFDELLLLIYETYPEYKDRSCYYWILDRKKKRLVMSLLKKSLITNKRAEEILTKGN